jgi:hypothetical protein
MIRVLIFTLSFLFSTNSGFAKEITVAILGAMPTGWEEQDFGQTVLNLTRAAEKKGDEIIIAAPFKMNFINGKNPDLSYFRLEDLDQVEGLMKKLKEKTKSGDTVNLLLYGHGVPTTNEKDYNETKIQLGSERVEMNDLIEIVNDTLPLDRGIKTIAPFCFSGSVHLLSHSRKNSCSTAASDFRTPSEGESSCFFGSCEAISSYGMSISKLIKENPEISLSQAHEIISEKDHLNNRRGQLSSIDYIQRIFKKGPYKVRKSFFGRMFSDYPDETPDKNYLSKSCENISNPENLVVAQLDDLFEKTRVILENFNIDNLFVEGVPKVVKDSMTENFDRYKDGFEEESKSLSEVHQNISYNISEYNKELNEKGFANWEETKFINRLKDELNQKTNEILRYHLYKERIELINLLYKKGKKSQIEKFENLVMCENNG